MLSYLPLPWLDIRVLLRMFLRILQCIRKVDLRLVYRSFVIVVCWVRLLPGHY